LPCNWYALPVAAAIPIQKEVSEIGGRGRPLGRIRFRQKKLGEGRIAAAGRALAVTKK